MRLLSWNLHFGRGAKAWPPLAAALGADVVFLQEAPAPAAGPWSQLWRPVPGRSWGSAVGVARGAVDRRDVDGYEGWVIGGEWRDGAAAGVPTFVYSVHAPTSSKESRRGSYVSEVRRIVDAIVAHVPADATIILGGDFNFASFGARVEGEAIRAKPGERAALERFASRGLVPLWHAVHPGRPLPQTLRWSKDPTVPYHCDGFLLSASLVGRAVCEVLDAPVLRGASDHSPVAAWVL